MIDLNIFDQINTMNISKEFFIKFGMFFFLILKIFGCLEFFYNKYYFDS